MLINKKKGSFLIKFLYSTHFFGMPTWYQALKTVMHNVETLTITLSCGLKAVKALSPKPVISFLMGLLVSTISPLILPPQCCHFS